MSQFLLAVRERSTSSNPSRGDTLAKVASLPLHPPRVTKRIQATSPLQPYKQALLPVFLLIRRRRRPALVLRSRLDRTLFLARLLRVGMGLLEFREGAFGFLLTRTTHGACQWRTRRGKGGTNLASGRGHGRVVRDGFVASLDAGVVLASLASTSTRVVHSGREREEEVRAERTFSDWM